MTISWETAPKRLAEKYVERDMGFSTPCWVWTSRLDRDGYGTLAVAGRLLKAHRVSWELAHGEPPPPYPDFEFDHLCRTRACVNPDHLEVVTHAENSSRGRPRHQTHCVNGHEFTPENTYWRLTGGRKCRECTRAYSRRHYWLQKEQTRQAAGVGL